MFLDLGLVVLAGGELGLVLVLFLLLLDPLRDLALEELRVGEGLAPVALVVALSEAVGAVGAGQGQGQHGGHEDGRPAAEQRGPTSGPHHHRTKISRITVPEIKLDEITGGF